MKRIVLILTLFLLFTSTVFAQSATVRKELTIPASDGFSLKATLEYPKIKTQKEFKTVVLLHSLGYNSAWWENLPKTLLDKGYAVLAIDLRGHGKSIYNTRLVRTSWSNMTASAYQKYPSDVIQIIDYVKAENPKRIFFNEWAIVSADIGGSAGIIASAQMENKPKTIVILSPVVKTHGLFVPVKLANLDNVDIFSITGTEDHTGQKAQDYLQRFAQAGFVTYVSEAHATGMLLLKNDKSLTNIITTWITDYLK